MSVISKRNKINESKWLFCLNVCPISFSPSNMSHCRIHICYWLGEYIPKKITTCGKLISTQAHRFFFLVGWKCNSLPTQSLFSSSLLPYNCTSTRPIRIVTSSIKRKECIMYHFFTWVMAVIQVFALESFIKLNMYELYIFPPAHSHLHTKEVKLACKKWRKRIVQTKDKPRLGQ